jgi:hypothetical protein
MDGITAAALTHGVIAVAVRCSEIILYARILIAAAARTIAPHHRFQ